MGASAKLKYHYFEHCFSQCMKKEMGGGCGASLGRPLILELIAKHGFTQGCALNAFFALGCCTRITGGGVGTE